MRFIWLWGLTCLVYGGGIGQVWSQESTMDTVRSVYKERKQNVSSLRWEWDGVRILESELESFPNYPAKATVLNAAGSVVIIGSETKVGSKARIDRRYVGWNETLGETEPDSVAISVYKGAESKSYWQHQMRGLVSKESEAEHIIDLKFIALTFAEAPLFLSDPRFELLSQVKSPQGTIVIGDSNQLSNEFGREEYILDPELGYAITGWRYLDTENETLWNVKVEYEPNEQQLTPISFELFRYSPANPDVLIEHQLLNITNFEINAKIDEEIFNYEFPHGTKVYNKILDVELTVGIPEDLQNLLKPNILETTSEEPIELNPENDSSIYETSSDGKIQDDTTQQTLSKKRVGIVCILICAVIMFVYIRRSPKKNNA